jgi:antirestriction protein
MNDHEQERKHERAPGAASHEALARDGPRIYVASLSDYNNGILHGRWVEAIDDTDAMHAEVAAMLQSSPTARRYGEVAEEWAIHDYEGFGELRLAEYDSLTHIAKIATGITRHGLAFTAWADHVNSDEELLDQFEERYQGEWESVVAYAEDLLDQLDAERVVSEAPGWLQSYLSIDAAGFARDLELNGDIVTLDQPDRRVWVFINL